MLDNLNIAFLIVLLLPGIVASALYVRLTPTREPGWQSRVVIAILLSYLAYYVVHSFSTVTRWIPDPEWILLAKEDQYELLFSGQLLLTVILACLVSTVFSLGLVVAQKHQVIYRIAQKAGFSAKTGLFSHWDSTMIEQRENCFALVKMRDGGTYFGWIASHSDVSDERSFLLVRVIETNSIGDSLTWPPRESILFSSLTDIVSIRFIPEMTGAINGKAGSTEQAKAVGEETDGD